MILIADCHISNANGNVEDFLKFLDALATSTEPVVFLGDVFELWIALPRYEDAVHRQFLAWCESRKGWQRVGFVEGNKEFFVAQERAAAFAWCAPIGKTDADQILYLHGDLINVADVGYRRFRRAVRNPLTKTLMRGLPFGAVIAHAVRKKLKRRAAGRCTTFPEQAVKAFADAKFEQGIGDIFVGHFHRKYQYCNGTGGHLHLLPAWFETGEVTRYDRAGRTVTHLHWRDLT